MVAANLHTKSDCTIQISFTGGNGALNTPGATNVSFTLFDIDEVTRYNAGWWGNHAAKYDVIS